MPKAGAGLSEPGTVSKRVRGSESRCGSIRAGVGLGFSVALAIHGGYQPMSFEKVIFGKCLALVCPSLAFTLEANSMSHCITWLALWLNRRVLPKS